MRRNPFDDLEETLDRMSRQLEEGMFRGVPGAGGVAVDVADHAEKYVVTADLPGYDVADIDLTFDDGRLRIEAERTEEHEQREGEYLRRERDQETASRSLRLPEPVDADEIVADYTNGVLTVTLPKEGVDEDSGRSIDIS